MARRRGMDPGREGVGGPAGRGPRGPVRRALRPLAAVVLLLAVFSTATALYAVHRLSGNLDRIDGVFTGLDDRPARATTGTAAHAVNILLLGGGQRSAAPPSSAQARSSAWLPGGHRPDAIMLLHIDGDRRGATILSVPRDSWLEVPGHGHGTAEEGVSIGGPSLAVATVESLTGVRVDHLAIIDWEGFAELTDAAGDVTVDVPRTVRDPERNLTWTMGRHLLDREQALAYVGQRDGLPHGELDRLHRQQNFLRALLRASLHQEMRTNPVMLYRFLDTLTRHLSVDADWSTAEMARLAVSLRNLRSADLRYLTPPMVGLGHVGSRSVVRLDDAEAGGLWQAVRDDTLDSWTATHPDALLPVLVP